MPNDATSRTDQLGDPEEVTGSRSDSSAADPGQSARPAPAELDARPLTRRWVAAWGVFSALLAVAGVAPLIVAYSTRISIEKLDPLDPKDPFTTPFALVNVGNFSIHDVSFSCRILNIENTFGGRITDSLVGYLGVSPIPELAPGDGTTTYCREPGYSAVPIIRIDVAIRATYRPFSLAWWQRDYQARYIAVKAQSDEIRFLRRGLQEE